MFDFLEPLLTLVSDEKDGRSWGRLSTLNMAADVEREDINVESDLPRFF